MLLSYVGVFMAVTPAVVGTTFLSWARSARTQYVTEANLPSSQPSNPLSGPTSPRPCTAPHEASPPFRQSLLSIARGTDAPRMRRRPGTFRTRELSYRRLSAAALRIAG